MRRLRVFAYTCCRFGAIELDNETAVSLKFFVQKYCITVLFAKISATGSLAFARVYVE